MTTDLSALAGFLQAMNKSIEELQARLGRERIEAAAAGGLVKCTVSGLGEVMQVSLDGAKLGLDEAASKQLQDAVTAAVRGALQAAAKRREAVQEEFAGGFGR